jgi:hypothetical protein
MYIVYCIFLRMLGGFLHICTCTCNIYCGLWPPDNTSCTFITWYQSPGLGLIFLDAQLVCNSGRRRPVPPVASHLRGALCALALCSPPRSPQRSAARIGLQLETAPRAPRPHRPRRGLLDHGNRQPHVLPVPVSICWPGLAPFWPRPAPVRPALLFPFRSAGSADC